MAKSGKKKIFLSYAHRDGKELAFWLFEELENAGFEAWIDRDRLAPGENWSKGIEQALDAADAVIAVLSAGAGESEICRAEHLRSLRKGRRVLAVRTAEDVDPPLYLEQTQWITFGAGADGERLAELVKALGGRRREKLVEKYKKTYQTIPPLPDNYVARPEDLEKLRDKLLAESPHRNIAVTAARGMGGAGKTVLAQALCREDELVRAAFPGGIVWLTVGQDLDIVSVMREIPRALGVSAEGWDSVQACSNQLKTLLKGKSVLLVLDDVWDVRHLELFKVDEPTSRILLTTRNAEVVAGAGGNQHIIGELSDTEARALLAKQAGLLLEDLPAEAEVLIAECGRLPLAIAMTGAMVRDGRHEWSDVVEALCEADLEWIDQPLDHSLHRSLFQALHVSVEWLPDKLGNKYVDLAVFEQDVAYPETALAALWGDLGRTVRKTAQKLVDYSLARWDEEKRLTLHDLQHDYVRNQARKREGDRLETLHRRIVNGYWTGAWYEGPQDGYYFEYLAHHLRLAGRRDELRDLLLDPRWLEAKLQAAGAHALTLDYDELPEDEELRLVQGAVRLSSHVIESDPEQLTSQMIGRLLQHESETLVKVRTGCATLRDREWLEPEWPTLGPPGTALLRTLQGHARGVIAVALTADGCRAASASVDKTLKVWDVESGQELRTLRGHVDWVNAVALSGDGRLAVSASSDKTLKVWDVDGGEELRTLEGHTGRVLSVALSSDGRRALSASDDKSVKVWDVERGQELRSLEGHTGRVLSVALSADGGRAISASDDKSVKVWDVESSREVRTLEGHPGKVTSVALAADGRRAVSASSDRTVKVWDVESGREFWTLRGHTRKVLSVGISADGWRAASVADDKALKVWDLASGRELRTLEGHAGRVLSVALTADGRRAVSGAFDRTVKVWDVESGEELRALAGHNSRVTSAKLTADGRLAVSASDDKTLKVWDVASGRELRTLTGHSRRVLSVALSADGRLAVSAADDQTLKVWDVESGRELRTLTGHSRRVLSVALSADGRLAVSASDDQTVRVWDVEIGRELRTLLGHATSVLSTALSADGKMAVSAASDKTLKVWDVRSGRRLRTLHGHAGRVLSVALSACGRWVMSASADKTLKVWDMESGRVLRTLEGHARGVNGVALTATGRAVSASEDQSIAIWKIEGGERACRFVGDAQFTAVAVSGDGQVILAGDEAGRVHKLRLREGTRK